MRKTVMLLTAAAMLPLGACSQYGGGGLFGSDPYYADDYYRGGDYRERVLDRDDVIYRGRDGRYYCRRSDGTTGLIVGGLAGGVLGNIIAPGGSKTLGTILGAAGGAVIGQQVDKGEIRCR